MGIKITVEVKGGCLACVYASGNTPEENDIANNIQVALLDIDEDVMEEKERLELQDFVNNKQVRIY